MISDTSRVRSKKIASWFNATKRSHPRHKKYMLFYTASGICKEILPVTMVFDKGNTPHPENYVIS
jgi:hypothetical protein